MIHRLFLPWIVILLIFKLRADATESAQTVTINLPNNSSRVNFFSFNKACQGCFDNGLIMFGDSDSMLNKIFFNHFYQGIPPKGFALINAKSWDDFYIYLTSLKNRDQLIKELSSYAQNLKLAVAQRDFANIRVLSTIDQQVIMSEKEYELFQIKKNYCEKDQCSPKIVLLFKDTDGESIRIYLYSGSSTQLWRNSKDSNLQNLASKKKLGIAYWGHIKQYVRLR